MIVDGRYPRATHLVVAGIWPRLRRFTFPTALNVYGCVPRLTVVGGWLRYVGYLICYPRLVQVIACVIAVAFPPRWFVGFVERCLAGHLTGAPFTVPLCLPLYVYVDCRYVVGGTLLRLIFCHRTLLGVVVVDCR